MEYGLILDHIRVVVVRRVENRTTSKCRMCDAEGSRGNRKLSKPPMYTDDCRLEY